MIRQFELIEKVRAYDPKLDEDLLNKAYVYAMKAHGSQKRASGDPYFSHPLEVAGILSDMRLDSATIVTALLHDTVEDTHATLEEIESLFGKEIATLVDGVTKLTKIELQSANTRQAENLRKLVLAMSNDIRVLLVKLADRLHNMRTLHYVGSEEKRRRIARETLEIYAPLSERIGIHHIKDELEDLSFEVLNPDARESILNRLSFLEQEGGRALVERIVQALKALLKEQGLEAKIFGRLKKPYSIWRKMRDQNISIDQLSDIMAFRVLVDSVGGCYQALGILHSTYHVMPGRFKDFISTPKANQYQSLHTTLLGPENKKIEVQIRTKDMHDVAELGVAAHWQYKQGAQNKETSEYKWLRSLLEILEHAQDPEEFLEHTKLEIFQDQVFAFTPQGDLISLPRGSTPIDFAYAIHSQVGNHCVGAIINGRMVPLRTILQNGDQVEIRTSKTQVPSPSWERLVRTGKARAHIRRFTRTQQRDQYVNLGRSLLHKVFNSEHVDFSEKLLESVLGSFHLSSLDDLYAQVGENIITPLSVVRVAAPGHGVTPVVEEEILPKRASVSKESKQTQSMSIRGLIPGMAIHYAGCCHPLPGDKIVGIVMTGRGVTIHTYDCPNLQAYAHEPDRWIDVSWDNQEGQAAHIGRLFVLLAHKTGALAQLTSIISAHKANIVNLRFHSRSEDFYEVILDIEVKGSDHLSNILAALRASSYIQTVERMRS